MADALRPGRTGCLRRGWYNLKGELRFNHGGGPGQPITLKSYPGERAGLTGGLIFVPSGSNFVTLANLRIDTHATNSIGIQIMASDAALIGNRITNEAAHASCVILGSNTGWGRAVRTVIANNVIHDCGSRADGMQDHAIYFDNSADAVVTQNVIWGTSGFAIHLYQNAQGSLVLRNVIDHNGYGVIFAGSSEFASSGNTVEGNLITNTTSGYDVTSWWGSTTGTRNVLRGNCIYHGRLGTIDKLAGGFTMTRNLIANPRYVDARRHDYALKSNSRCVSVVGFRGVRAG